MSKASGVVTKFFSKKAGNRGGKVYSFIINDDGVWYNCGFDDPKVKEGDSISFTYEETEYQPGKISNGVDVNSIEVAEKAVKKPVKNTGGKALDMARQHTISLQAAYNTATSIVTTLCNNDQEVFAKMVGKTDKNKLHNLVANVEALAEELFEKFLKGDEKAKELLSDNSEAGDIVEHKGSSTLDD